MTPLLGMVTGAKEHISDHSQQKLPPISHSFNSKNFLPEGKMTLIIHYQVHCNVRCTMPKVIVSTEERFNWPLLIDVPCMQGAAGPEEIPHLSLHHVAECAAATPSPGC